jgi:hypothetical protein
MSKAAPQAISEWRREDTDNRLIEVRGRHTAISVLVPGTYAIAIRINLPWDLTRDYDIAPDYAWMHFANLEAELKRNAPLPDHVAKAVADLIAAMREAYGVEVEA